jgi:hypothetical protein
MTSVVAPVRAGVLTGSAPPASRRRVAPAGLVLAAVLAGCVQPGVTDLLARPAERALVAGLQAYDDGRYGDAERALRAALDAGLPSGRDRATAHKHLAFLYCTSDRERACEEAFAAARRADPAFLLSRSEAGHPMWGPVYRRVVR